MSPAVDEIERVLGATALRDDFAAGSATVPARAPRDASRGVPARALAPDLAATGPDRAGSREPRR